MSTLRSWLVAAAMLASTFLIGGLVLAGADALFPAVAQAVAKGSEPPDALFAIRAAATEIGLLVPAAILLALSHVPLRWRVRGGDLSSCAGALAAMFVTNGAGSWLMARIGEAYGGFPSLTGGRWLLAAVICCVVVFAPIAEELYFREALLCRVFAGSTRPYALAMTALLFGGLHAASGGAVLFVSLSILGALLGWVRLKTGSIGAAIAVHALHNAFALLFATGFGGGAGGGSGGG